MIDFGRERRVTEEQVRAVQIKTPTIHTHINNLSGGNQQKVLISRVLLTDPEVFVSVELTRGIDIGAKHEIYKIIRDLTIKGKSVLMISS